MPIAMADAPATRERSRCQPKISFSNWKQMDASFKTMGRSQLIVQKTLDGPKILLADLPRFYWGLVKKKKVTEKKFEAIIRYPNLFECRKIAKI